MKKYLGYVWIAAIISAFIASGYLLRVALENEPEKEVIVKTDTLIVRDTIVENRPVYVTKIKTETDTVELTKIVRLQDTSAVVIPIDHTQYHYEDADVWIHGYDAAVDSIQVYPKTAYITTTKTIQQKAPRFSLGISAGYGAGKEGLTPFIGIGINYRLVNFPKRKARIDYD